MKTADATYSTTCAATCRKARPDYDELKEHNPKIVCVHLSAYGRTGSRASWPGYDYLMQAEAGYLSLTGEPDGLPRASASPSST